MPKLTLGFCLAVSFILCLYHAKAAYAPIDYYGNGWTDGGGEVGGGKMTLTGEGVGLIGTFKPKEGTTFGDYLVLYIDSTPNGQNVNSTANLTASGNSFKNAVSGYDTINSPPRRSVANFASGFGADYAIVLSPASSNLKVFSLTPIGDDLLPEKATVTLSSGANGYQFTVPWGSIGLPEGQGNSFLFQSGYAMSSGAKYKEGFETVSGTGGWGGTINYSNFNTFNAVPEPTTMALCAFGVTALLSAGWKRWRG